MKRILSFLFLTIITISCSHTRLVTISSTPPEMYEIKNIETTKDLIDEYRKSVMKVAEWQNWYNTEVGSNYYINRR